MQNAVLVLQGISMNNVEFSSEALKKYQKNLNHYGIKTKGISTETTKSKMKKLSDHSRIL